MKAQRWGIGLSVANLVLLAIVVAGGLTSGVRPTAADGPQASPRSGDEVVPVLRGRALELVDEGGQIRSRLNVEADGAVVLRLIDRKGTIRVKLGAGEDGSGLVLLDETTEPGVQMIARRTGTSTRPATTSLTLRGADGRQRTITP